MKRRNTRRNLRKNTKRNLRKNSKRNLRKNSRKNTRRNLRKNKLGGALRPKTGKEKAELLQAALLEAKAEQRRLELALAESIADNISETTTDDYLEYAVGILSQEVRKKGSEKTLWCGDG